MKRWMLMLSAAVLCGATSAQAACRLEKIAEIPVTMENNLPMVDVEINGQKVRFLLDSGSRVSTISAETAQRLGLPIDNIDVIPNFAMSTGIPSHSQVSVARTRQFLLNGKNIPYGKLFVTSDDRRHTERLGQDILAFADIEDDLPHGVVRLMRPRGCGDENLAYWASGQQVMTARAETIVPDWPHSMTMATVNGTKLWAMFDTGSTASVITEYAARRAGVTLTSPNVEPAGSVGWLNREPQKAWFAQFDKLAIGDLSLNGRSLTIRAHDIDLSYQKLFSVKNKSAARSRIYL